MSSPPRSHAASRGSAATILLVVLACLTLSGCREQPREVPVRTSTASGSWTAPSAVQAAERDRALVRVVSAIPGIARLDLFVNGEKPFEVLEYKTVTPFLEVPAGRGTVRLRPAGLDTAEPLADETQQLRAGRHYTVVLMPGEEGRGATALRVVEDPMDFPGENRARLRVVHAAGDAGQLDVRVEGRDAPLVAGLDFQSASDFTELEPPPAGAVVEVRPANRTETMLRVTDLRLAGGGLYTVVIIGRTRFEPPLEGFVLEDRLAAR